MSIWVHFDENWDKDRSLKYLNELVSGRKLEIIGYKLPWQIREYKVADWDEKENILEYTCYFPKLYFDIFWE